MKKIFILCFTWFFSAQVLAETYQIFMPLGPGAPTEVMVRKMVATAEKITNDKFIVINKPGSEFVIAYQEFLREGQRNKNVIFYNQAGFSVTTGRPEYAALNLRPLQEVKGLITILSHDLLLVTKKDGPLKTLSDVRGKLNVSYVGSTGKLMLDKLQSADPDVQMIAYKTDTQSATAILSNEVQAGVILDFGPAYLGNRDNLLVLSDSKKMTNTTTAFGFSVHQSMPDSKVTELNQLFNKVFNDPEFSTWFVNTYRKRPHGGSPQEFDRLIMDYHKTVVK